MTNRQRTIKPRALKAGKAAEYVGISRRYLHDLTQQGRIPVHKIGPRCYVYDLTDLDSFLDACKIGGE
ncbi:MAG: helix-turn-helix domain-containing protein [Deltaproteobacteria bacterium]|nr:helix-turn-helix domain-containing protein [Deltaproteobacteria bacterium]